MWQAYAAVCKDTKTGNCSSMVAYGIANSAAAVSSQPMHTNRILMESKLQTMLRLGDRWLSRQQAVLRMPDGHSYDREVPISKVQACLTARCLPHKYMRLRHMKTLGQQSAQKQP
ncbi:hypothetical protein ABBQ32_003522 [Trebouxia sp. C0010 RCD-2024]